MPERDSAKHIMCRPIGLDTSTHEESSDMRHQTELTHRYITAYGKNDMFVAYGCAKISKLLQWA